MTTYKGLQSSRARSSTQPWGNTWTDSNKVTLSAALATTDVIVLLDVPAGVRLETFRFYNEDMDTGTTVVYDIGYRTKLPDGTMTDLDYISNDGTVLRAATTTWQELLFEPVLFTEPVEIVLIASVAPAGQSGSKSIWAQATGSMVGIP
jgi:hypothetical protein